MSAIFDFVENILTNSGVTGDAMSIVSQVFEGILKLFEMIGNLFGGLLG